MLLRAAFAGFAGTSAVDVAQMVKLDSTLGSPALSD